MGGYADGSGASQASFFRPLHPATVAGYAAAVPLPFFPSLDPVPCSDRKSPFLVPSLQKQDLSERPERVKGPKRLAALGGKAA